MDENKQGLGLIIILAPFIFTGHFLEESPGFVAWFNAHVNRGITQPLFWNVNITALVITIVVVITELAMPSELSAAFVVVWLGFLMFANAVFHITGAIRDQRYMPGLITAIALYLPYFFFVVVRLLQRQRLKLLSIIILTVVGSSLMLIHGYLIIFRGSRLF